MMNTFFQEDFGTAPLLETAKGKAAVIINFARNKYTVCLETSYYLSSDVRSSKKSTAKELTS